MLLPHPRDWCAAWRALVLQFAPAWGCCNGRCAPGSTRCSRRASRACVARLAHSWRPPALSPHPYSVPLALTCTVRRSALLPLAGAAARPFAAPADPRSAAGRRRHGLAVPQPGCEYVWDGFPHPLQSFQGHAALCRVPGMVPPSADELARFVQSAAAALPLRSLGGNSGRHAIEAAAMQAVRRHPAAALGCASWTGWRATVPTCGGCRTRSGRRRTTWHFSTSTPATPPARPSAPQANPHTRRDLARGWQELQLGLRHCTAEDMASAAASRSLLALRGGGGPVCALPLPHGFLWVFTFCGLGARAFGAVPGGGRTADVLNWHGVPLVRGAGGGVVLCCRSLPAPALNFRRPRRAPPTVVVPDVDVHAERGCACAD